MAVKTLTERTVQTAKTDRERGEDIRDTVVRGLVLRVYASGVKTWIVRYTTQEGRRRAYKLGDVAARLRGTNTTTSSIGHRLTLAEARRRAQAALGTVAQGEDPQSERVAKRVRPGAETVADLAADYLERYSRKHKRPRSVREEEAQIKRYVLPHWGKLPARDITRPDVKRLLDDLASGKVSATGEPTTTAPRQLRALLSKMFAWAVDEEILPANPAAGIKLPKPLSRDRVLSQDEIRVLWGALDEMEEENPLSAAAFRLLLLTAQRPGEVLGMRWSEIDGEWWTIPQERHKGHKSHRVPLSPRALEELEKVRTLTGHTEQVFDSPTVPGQPLSTLKTANHGIIRRQSMERWTPHDLRRTAATHMTSGGTERLVVERILGHAEHGVAAVYDRASYDQEKRRALGWWANQVAAIATGRTDTSNVFEFRRVEAE